MVFCVCVDVLDVCVGGFTCVITTGFFGNPLIYKYDFCLSNLDVSNIVHLSYFLFTTTVSRVHSYMSDNVRFWQLHTIVCFTTIYVMKSKGKRVALTLRTKIRVLEN